MDRIKRLSYEVLEKHKSKFGEDFSKNKKSLDEIAIVRSKGLKNEVAGYITNFIKKENREAEFNLSQKTPSKEEVIQKTPELSSDPLNDSEEKIIEIGVDNAEVKETAETSEEKSE